MPVVSALSYDPTLKTVTVAGDIATINLTSIINYTKGKDLFVAGRTPVTNRVFSGGNTTFTLDTNTAGDSVSDVLAVRYQSSNILASISNGAIVNGVAHFVQSTKPLTRVDGTTLVVGDKWYKTTTGEDWFWNGTYWLTGQLFAVNWNINASFGASGSTTANYPKIIKSDWEGLFVTTFWIHTQAPASTNWTATNYTSFLLNVSTTGGNNIGLASFDLNNISAAGKYVVTINTFRTLGVALAGSGGVRDFILTAVKVGTASNLVAMPTLEYRGVHP